MLNGEYGFTILVNEENILKNSEVYEVCDVQIQEEDNLENATDVQQISEDAEDDQMVHVSFLSHRLIFQTLHTC